jgi:hypothetical protein
LPRETFFLALPTSFQFPCERAKFFLAESVQELGGIRNGRYFVPPSIMKKKSFITYIAGDDCTPVEISIVAVADAGNMAKTKKKLTGPKGEFAFEGLKKFRFIHVVARVKVS